APPRAVEPDDVPAQDPLQRSFLLRLLRSTSYAKQILAADAGPSTYERLGFRVPAGIVSPVAPPPDRNTPGHDPPSIHKLIERKWNLPPLTRRDAAAIAPLDALDLQNPPRFLTPPSLPLPARQWRG